MALALAILVFAIMLGATGQILLKSGLNQLGYRPGPVQILSAIFTNIRVFGGLACYGFSSIFYLMALSRLPLSYAYPLIALSYVFVTVLAWRVLGETVPALRVAGLGIILAGVVVVALSYTKPAAALPADGGVPEATTPIATP